MEAEREVLRRAVERLYAGFYIYGALAYLSWLPALSVFIVVVASEWYLGLPGVWKAVVATVYWAGAAAVFAYSMARFWRGYLARIGARAEALGARRRCGKLHLLWLLVFPLIYGVAALLEGVGVGAGGAFATGLVASLSYGSLVNVAVERCYGERLPPSIIAAVVLAASTPLTAAWGWLVAIAAIMLAYSLTSIAYLLAAIKRL